MDGWSIGKYYVNQEKALHTVYINLNTFDMYFGALKLPLPIEIVTTANGLGWVASHLVQNISMMQV